jgi:ubiquinone/menaquinone biosynthesis C-methylase UbiE
VLETAVGTGLNLPFYNFAVLQSLTAIDLSPGMLAQAQRRAQQLQMPVKLVQADVERLQDALAGQKFDTIVDTFSLCVFPDPLAALHSMASSLRSNGSLLLLEHSRSKFGPLGLYQVNQASWPWLVAAPGKQTYSYSTTHNDVIDRGCLCRICSRHLWRQLRKDAGGTTTSHSWWRPQGLESSRWRGM